MEYMGRGGATNFAELISCPSHFSDTQRRIVAAISLLCSAPMPLVENLLQSRHREAILIPCKAAQLQWPTVRAILNCRSIAGKVSDLDVDSARTDFIKLSPSGALRVLRFWQVRHTVASE